MNGSKKYICCFACYDSAVDMNFCETFHVQVVKVHNNTMIVGRVQHTNALLRFRFMRPLDIKVVASGDVITISKCQFSLVTKMINCLEVEQDIFKVQRRCEFLVDA